MFDRKLTHLCVIAAALVTPSCSQLTSTLELGQQLDPIDIQFVIPPGATDAFAYEPVSGWPLTLRLIAEKSQLLGIGSVVTPRRFPARDTSAYIVMSDPDNCYSWVDEAYQQMHHLAMEINGNSSIYPNCLETEQTLPIPWQQDEKMVKVIPGLTHPEAGVCGQRPEIFTFDKAVKKNTQVTKIGPCVGSAMDGYGYGRSERLPGLVVVADTGASVVYDMSMNRPDPIVARNLAGFLNSVGYHLKDHHSRTSILAHVLVPFELFSPVILADYDAHPEFCLEDEAWVRIDGESGHCVLDNDVRGLFDEQLVTARAFVVNEEAPSTLADLNQDGIVSSADAVADGFSILSNETVIRFRQVYDFPLAWPFDVNGDEKTGDVVAPPGPGQLTPPPH